MSSRQAQFLRALQIRLSCVTRCVVQDPPSAGENSLSVSDYWRVSRFRAQTRLGSHGVLTSRQERFAMQLRERLPDSGSGLIIGDFTLSLLPQSQVSNTRTLQKLYEFLARCSFCLNGDSGLVSSRRVRYRLVWPFSIPVDSPRDKRGIVWSGNRGLRFGIGADNRRFCVQEDSRP